MALRSYVALRREFLEKYPGCMCRISGCGGQATDVHHMLGKDGRRLLLVRYWLPVCRVCHDWITENSNKATEMGFSLFRGMRGIDWTEYTIAEAEELGYLFGNKIAA